MRSFVQARYVHWRIVGKCPIHKNTFVVVQLFVTAQYIPILFSFWSVVRFLSGRISFPALLSREFNHFLRASLQPTERQTGRQTDRQRHSEREL